MVRTGLAIMVAGLTLGVATAEAQTPYTGMLTGHIGPVAGGDVNDLTVSLGGSMAVIENSGLGVELDIGHSGDFDSTLFSDSSITPITLNVVAMYPSERIRPFLIVGAGVLRVRVAYEGQPSTGDTDAAWSAGGGALYMLNERFGLRADLRYFRHFSRQDIPLGDNGVLDFIRTSVGFTYSWPLK